MTHKKHIDEPSNTLRETVPVVLKDVLPNVPFSSAEEMEQSATLLADRESQAQVVKILNSTILGDAVQEFVNQCFPARATNLALSNYNWKGTKQANKPAKYSFDKHPLCKIIFTAVQKRGIETC